MDLSFSAEQQALEDRIEAFCAQHCTDEIESARDRDPAFPEALHRALCNEGLLGTCLPIEYGGAGGAAIEACILYQGFGRHSASATNLLFVNGICGSLIAVAGTEEQKREILPALASGRLRLAFGLTEPEAGSDAAAIALRAAREGEGYVLDGTKLFTTGAREADLILTAARTDADERASKGTSLFLVPRPSDGLTITAMDKIAGNAVGSCRVDYRGVRVPSSALLGVENQGWGVLMMGGGLERLAVAASAVGAAEAVLRDVIAFVSERRQYGQPVGAFQSVQHQIADIATEIEAMRWLTYAAAWKTDRGTMPAKEISMAKLYATERASEIAMRGMRLLGGRAYLHDTPMARRLREVMLFFYAGGTVEIQRNLIARALGLPPAATR